jgi:hypothetical protein
MNWETRVDIHSTGCPQVENYMLGDIPNQKKKGWVTNEYISRDELVSSIKMTHTPVVLSPYTQKVKSTYTSILRPYTGVSVEFSPGTSF